MATTKVNRSGPDRAGKRGPRKNKRTIRGVARPAMGRIIEIHRLLAARRFPNCTYLTREFEVTRQTVLADIRYMRDQMDLPVEWSQEDNGYFYGREVHDFPIGEIAAGDLAAIFLARHTLADIQSSLLGERVRGVLGSVLDTLKDKLRFSWTELDHAFSVKATAPKLSEVTMFEKVGAALLEHRVLSFRYRKAGSASLENRRLEPYHLTQVEGCWYVLGRDPDRDGLRTFALQRMESPRLLTGRFKVAREFDVEEVLGRAFGVWNTATSRAEHEVVVELTGYAARMAAERRWHASQREEWLKGKTERVRVRFRVSRFEDVTRWVLGWGSQAKVLGPPELVEKIAAETMAMAKAYRG